MKQEDSVVKLGISAVHGGEEVKDDGSVESPNKQQGAALRGMNGPPGAHHGIGVLGLHEVADVGLAGGALKGGGEQGVRRR